jgi:hypothetical protein
LLDIPGLFPEILHGMTMKKRALILFLFASLLFGGEVAAADYTFDRTSFDLGTVQAGKTSRISFTVTNNGTLPLLITEARVSCKCVKVSRPRAPILPGQSAKLTVSHKERRAGVFYKTIEVKTNGDPEKTRLTLKGTIKK